MTAHAKRFRVRRLLGIVLGVLVLLAALAWMSDIFRFRISPGVVPEDQATAAGRSLAAVETLKTTQTIDVVGTVEPRRKIDVASQILATVSEVKVNAGDSVEVGQLLVELDDRQIQAQLGETEAALAGAQADLDVRQRDFQRYQQMLAGKAVTQEDFDRVRGAYEGAQAQVKRIQQQIARIKVTLSHTQIQARAAGIVADRYVDPGDLAAPGKPLLTLYDPRERELHASVPESLMSNVKLGAELTVCIDAVDRSWQGVVREIVPQAQEASRSILIKVTLPPEAAAEVMIGMFGRLAIPSGQSETIVAPTAAVAHVGQLDLVEVADTEGRLEKRFVRTGAHFGDKIEILSGLEVGQKVALP